MSGVDNNSRKHGVLRTPRKCTWEYAAHVTVTLTNERVLVFVRTPEAGLGHCTWLNTEN